MLVDHGLKRRLVFSLQMFNIEICGDVRPKIRPGHHSGPNTMRQHFRTIWNLSNVFNRSGIKFPIISGCSSMQNVEREKEVHSAVHSEYKRTSRKIHAILENSYIHGIYGAQKVMGHLSTIHSIWLIKALIKL